MVVSADGCYVYLYALEDKGSEAEGASEGPQEGQDQATPGYDAATNMADNRMQQDTVAAIDAQRAAIPLSRVKIDTPQQSFARGAARCNEIYLPIQFVEGFSI